jgi:hypothetical protein
MAGRLVGPISGLLGPAANVVGGVPAGRLVIIDSPNNYYEPDRERVYSLVSGPDSDDGGRREKPAQENQGMAEKIPKVAGDEGLCRICIHRRLLRSPRSAFVRCALGSRGGPLPLYPRLPVQTCSGFTEQEKKS